MVITHSEIFKTLWYLALKLSTLSSITSKMLDKIANIKIISNHFPAGVSAS
jgi:hypothetical protein